MPGLCTGHQAFCNILAKNVRTKSGQRPKISQNLFGPSSGSITYIQGSFRHPFESSTGMFPHTVIWREVYQIGYACAWPVAIHLRRIMQTMKECFIVLEMNLIQMCPQMRVRVFHATLVNVITPGSNATRIDHPGVIHVPTPVNLDPT